MKLTLYVQLPVRQALSLSFDFLHNYSKTVLPQFILRQHCFFIFLGGGGLGFAVSCKKRFRRGRSFGFEPVFAAVDFAVFSKFALLRSQILKRGSFVLFVRKSTMQINRFTEIVVFVTSLGFTFFDCIALFWVCWFCFAFSGFAFAVRLRLGVFRLCGGDHGLCPLDSHKPLKRLDRNFKCFCAVTFVLLIGLCTKLTPRLPSWGSHFLGRA